MLINWTSGPAVADYDGPSLQCAAHLIATKHDGKYLWWTLFDRLPDGSLNQRFGGSALSGKRAEDMSRVVQMATGMLDDDKCRGR
jgi:hypothetical protein